MAAGKGRKLVAFKEVENTLAEKVCDNADVVAEIEGLSEVYTFISVLSVVVFQCVEDTQLNFTGITVFLHRPNDLDGAF